MLPKGGDDFWARYAWEDDPMSSDLSNLLHDSENIKRVLNSELCADNVAHDCSHTNTCTVESVLGNVKGRKVSALCHAHGIVFTVSAAGFCFSKIVVCSLCSWIAAGASSTKVQVKPLIFCMRT